MCFWPCHIIWMSTCLCSFTVSNYLGYRLNDYIFCWRRNRYIDWLCTNADISARHIWQRNWMEFYRDVLDLVLLYAYFICVLWSPLCTTTTVARKLQDRLQCSSWLMASIEVINKSVSTWVSLFMSMVDIVQLNASSSFCGSQDTQFRYWYVLQPLISIFFSVSEISKPNCHS